MTLAIISQNLTGKQLIFKILPETSKVQLPKPNIGGVTDLLLHYLEK